MNLINGIPVRGTGLDLFFTIVRSGPTTDGGLRMRDSWVPYNGYCIVRTLQGSVVQLVREEGRRGGIRTAVQKMDHE